MTAPSKYRWIARKLREVTKDETGSCPKFEHCLAIVERDGVDESVGDEEQACRLFEKHREELVG